jgi:hypothetical protein
MSDRLNTYKSRFDTATFEALLVKLYASKLHRVLHEDGSQLHMNMPFSFQVTNVPLAIQHTCYIIISWVWLFTIVSAL